MYHHFYEALVLFLWQLNWLKNEMAKIEERLKVKL